MTPRARPPPRRRARLLLVLLAALLLALLPLRAADAPAAPATEVIVAEPLVAPADYANGTVRLLAEPVAAVGTPVSAPGRWLQQGGEGTVYGRLALPAAGGTYRLVAELTAPGQPLRRQVLDEQRSVQNERFDVCFVIDTSFSMRENDPHNLRRAAINQFWQLAQHSRAIHGLGLVTFSDDAVLLLPVTPVARLPDPKPYLAKIRAGGSTNFDDAFDKAITAFAGSTGNRKAVIFLSDGHHIGYYEQGHRKLRALGCPAYCIGLSDEADAGTMARIASETGGTAYEAATADQLQPIFLRIFQLIEHPRVLWRATPQVQDLLDLPLVLDPTLRNPLLTVASVAAPLRVVVPGQPPQDVAAGAQTVCSLAAQPLGTSTATLGGQGKAIVELQAETDLYLAGFQVRATAPVDTPLALYAYLAGEAEATDSSVTAAITGPGAPGRQMTLTRTADGLYELTVPAASAGSYSVELTASGHTGGQPFVRRLAFTSERVARHDAQAGGGGYVASTPAPAPVDLPAPRPVTLPTATLPVLATPAAPAATLRTSFYADPAKVHFADLAPGVPEPRTVYVLLQTDATAPLRAEVVDAAGAAVPIQVAGELAPNRKCALTLTATPAPAAAGTAFTATLRLTQGTQQWTVPLSGAVSRATLLVDAAAPVISESATQLTASVTAQVRLTPLGQVPITATSDVPDLVFSPATFTASTAPTALTWQVTVEPPPAQPRTWDGQVTLSGPGLEPVQVPVHVVLGHPPVLRPVAPLALPAPPPPVNWRWLWLLLVLLLIMGLIWSSTQGNMRSRLLLLSAALHVPLFFLVLQQPRREEVTPAQVRRDSPPMVLSGGATVVETGVRSEVAAVGMPKAAPSPAASAKQALPLPQPTPETATPVTPAAAQATAPPAASAQPMPATAVVRPEVTPEALAAQQAELARRQAATSATVTNPQTATATPVATPATAAAETTPPRPDLPVASSPAAETTPPVPAAGKELAGAVNRGDATLTPLAPAPADTTVAGGRHQVAATPAPGGGAAPDAGASSAVLEHGSSRAPQAATPAGGALAVAAVTSPAAPGVGSAPAAPLPLAALSAPAATAADVAGAAIPAATAAGRRHAETQPAPGSGAAPEAGVATVSLGGTVTGAPGDARPTGGTLAVAPVTTGGPTTAASGSAATPASGAIAAPDAPVSDLTASPSSTASGASRHAVAPAPARGGGDRLPGSAAAMPVATGTGTAASDMGRGQALAVAATGAPTLNGLAPALVAGPAASSPPAPTAAPTDLTGAGTDPVTPSRRPVATTGTGSGATGAAPLPSVGGSAPLAVGATAGGAEHAGVSALPLAPVTAPVAAVTTGPLAAAAAPASAPTLAAVGDVSGKTTAPPAAATPRPLQAGTVATPAGPLAAAGSGAPAATALNVAANDPAPRRTALTVAALPSAPPQIVGTGTARGPTAIGPQSGGTSAPRGKWSNTLPLVKYGGDWDSDRTSMPNLAHQLERRTGSLLPIDSKVIELTSPELAQTPFVYLTGLRDFHFTDAELAGLRAYLTKGGSLWINDSTDFGDEAFDQAARRELARLLPGAELKRIPADHPLYQAPYDLTKGYRGYAIPPGDKYRCDYMEGVWIAGRLAVVYERNDYGDGLQIDPKTQPLMASLSDLSPEEMQEGAIRMGINLVLYFMNHGQPIAASVTQQVARDQAASARQATDWGKKPALPSPILATATTWAIPDGWADTLPASVARGTGETPELRLTLAAGAQPVTRKSKAVVAAPLGLELARNRALVLDVTSTLHGGARLAFACAAADGSGFIESAPVFIKPGENHDLVFDLRAKTFKSAASAWRYELALPATVLAGQCYFILYPLEGNGTITIQRVKVVEP